MKDIESRIAQAAAALNEGRLADAETDARSVLDELGEHARARHVLAFVRHRQGRTSEGLEELERALSMTEAKARAPLLYDMGRLCEAANDHARAAAAFGQAARLDPGEARYRRRHGRMLMRLARHEEGVAELRQAVRLAPGRAETHYSLAVALDETGRRPEAIEHYETALKHQPEHFAALMNLGAAYLQSGDLDRAEKSFRRAAACADDPSRAKANLAAVLMRRERLEDAVEAYRDAVRADPGNASTLGNMAVALANQVRHEEARQAMFAAIRADSSPSGPWDKLLFSHFYYPDHDPKAAARQHRNWGDGVEGVVLGAVPRPPLADQPPDRPLRVGFVSPDFCRHPLARFFLPLLRGADRERMTVHCFAQVGNRDEMTAHIRRLADGWHEIQTLSARQAAELVRSERIDVLIDLAGHTSNNRLDLFMERPAPVQATYLRYPGTTGLKSIQYRLTDRFADPPGRTEALHTERLARLPTGFLCFEPPGEAPKVGPLPAERNGFVTFGSFNNLMKLNKPVIALWAQLLGRVPGSRLLLKSRPLGDAPTAKRITALFASAGVARERLILKGRIESPAGHLDAYNDMDIALDTHPYNGTTTTCEALWMGVPVVTRAGSSHVGRVGVSLLKGAGLTDLVAGSADEYLRIAAALARDRTRLAGYRTELRARIANGPLTDTDRFAREFEDLMRALWHRERTESRGLDRSDGRQESRNQ